MKKQLAQKKQDLHETQKMYDDVYNVYEDAEQYTLKLAENFGENSISTQKHAEIRQEIQDLQELIKETEQKLSAAQQKVNPIEVDKLEKQFADLLPKITTYQQDIEVLNNESQEILAEIAEKITSQQYMVSYDSIIEHRVAHQCQNTLRSDVTKIFKSVNGAPSAQNGSSTSIANQFFRKDKNLQGLFDQHLEAQLNMSEIKLQKELAELHRTIAINCELEYVQELNKVIEFLGGEPVDIKEVKSGIDIGISEEEEDHYEREASNNDCRPNSANDEEESQINDS